MFRNDRLKLIRHQQRLSQSDMSERLKISARQYRRYEAGEVEPSADVLARLTTEFEISTNWLLGLSSEPLANTAARRAIEERIIEIASALDARHLEMVISYANFLKSQNGSKQ